MKLFALIGLVAFAQAGFHCEQGPNGFQCMSEAEMNAQVYDCGVKDKKSHIEDKDGTCYYTMAGNTHPKGIPCKAVCTLKGVMKHCPGFYTGYGCKK